MGDVEATAKLTMAELTRVAAERYREADAARFLRDGTWDTLTFGGLWQRVADVARGLIGLGSTLAYVLMALLGIPGLIASLALLRPRLGGEDRR